MLLQKPDPSIIEHLVLYSLQSRSYMSITPASPACPLPKVHVEASSDTVDRPNHSGDSQPDSVAKNNDDTEETKENSTVENSVVYNFSDNVQSVENSEDIAVNSEVNQHLGFVVISYISTDYTY